MRLTPEEAERRLWKAGMPLPQLDDMGHAAKVERERRAKIAYSWMCTESESVALLIFDAGIRELSDLEELPGLIKELGKGSMITVVTR